MAVASNGKLRESVNFSKILTSIQIPNLIEVQKKSYERFLQMNLLPGEREDIGLAGCFQLGIPDLRFPRRFHAGVRSFSIGNWECKCGNLKGLSHLRSKCKSCEQCDHHQSFFD